MAEVVSIGKQDFASIRENHYFYIDKTDLSGNGGNRQMRLRCLQDRAVLGKH